MTVLYKTLMFRTTPLALIVQLTACLNTNAAQTKEMPTDASTESAASYVQFVEDFPTGVCSQRQGKAVLIKSTHPTRKIKVTLDRYNSGVGTGDRSRSVLVPGTEPEALGCSRSDVGAQEWRVVKVEFVD